MSNRWRDGEEVQASLLRQFGGMIHFFARVFDNLALGYHAMRGRGIPSLRLLRDFCGLNRR
jgi:hypothetical protein